MPARVMAPYAGFRINRAASGVSGDHVRAYPTGLLTDSQQI